MYYRQHLGHADNLQDTCLDCEGAAELERHEELMKTRLKQEMVKVRKSTLPLLEKISEKGSHVPHVAEIFEKLMSLCGGSTGFAKEVILHLHSAPAGGMVKQRALDSIIKLAEKVSDSGAAQKSLDQYSDEDLDRELNQTVRQVLSLEHFLDESA